MYSSVFIGLGIIIQIAVYLISDCTLLSMVSGIFGVFAVVYCSERKMKQFFFSFAQMFTYVYIAYNERLYGEVAINVFYFILTSVAVWTWISNKTSDGLVKVKTLSVRGNVCVLLAVCTAFILGWWFLGTTDDSQPMMDSLTTVPAVAAQVFLMLRYREQWIYWFIIDVASVIMWFIAKDWCMVAQYIFWTVNCIYGWSLWSKNERKVE